jgi:hypothetical protein
VKAPGVFRCERDRPKQRLWLLIERGHLDLCMNDPGFEIDLVILTDSVTLTRVHAGRLGLREAQRAGAWMIEGPRDLVRAFSTWGGLSYYANVPLAMAPPPASLASRRDVRALTRS